MQRRVLRSGPFPTLNRLEPLIFKFNCVAHDMQGLNHENRSCAGVDDGSGDRKLGAGGWLRSGTKRRVGFPAASGTNAASSDGGTAATGGASPGAGRLCVGWLRICGVGGWSILLFRSGQRLAGVRTIPLGALSWLGTRPSGLASPCRSQYPVQEGCQRTGTSEA